METIEQKDAKKYIIKEETGNKEIDDNFSLIQIPGFSEIASVHFIVNYDNDEYRDGTCVIPSHWESISDLREYARSIAEEISRMDSYFNGMELVAVNSELIADDDEDKYLDISTIFRDPENGFKTSIDVSFSF